MFCRPQSNSRMCMLLYIYIYIYIYTYYVLYHDGGEISELSQSEALNLVI